MQRSSERLKMDAWMSSPMSALTQFAVGICEFHHEQHVHDKRWAATVSLKSENDATSFRCVFISHVFAWASADNIYNMLGKHFASMFRLYRIARSSTILFLNLLLVCLVNTTCAITNIMANLIFTIVSLSVACILSCCSCRLTSLHVLVETAVILLFQHRQHSKKHSQTQLLLNEIRDLHANVPCRSDLTRFWPQDNLCSCDTHLTNRQEG